MNVPEEVKPSEIKERALFTVMNSGLILAMADGGMPNVGEKLVRSFVK